MGIQQYTAVTMAIKKQPHENNNKQKEKSAKTGQTLSSATAAWMRNAICTKLGTFTWLD